MSCPETVGTDEEDEEAVLPLLPAAAADGSLLLDSAAVGLPSMVLWVKSPSVISVLIGGVEQIAPATGWYLAPYADWRLVIQDANGEGLWKPTLKELGFPEQRSWIGALNKNGAVRGADEGVKLSVVLREARVQREPPKRAWGVGTQVEQEEMLAAIRGSPLAWEGDASFPDDDEDDGTFVEREW